MTERGIVGLGGTDIAYSVVRSKRRKKTVQITLDPMEGVVVSAPLATPSSKIRELVERRAAWIVRRGLSGVLHPQPKQFVSGESLPYLGRQVRLFVERSDVARPQVRFDHWSFQLSVPRELNGDDRRPALAKAFERWYRHRAQARLESRVDRWAKKLGSPPPRVLTRDQRQRWGSCGPDGTLRFNWRIVMAEPPLMDYVVLHELMHLRVRNHSQDFWAAVASAMPDYRVRRARLRDCGPYLSL